MVTVPSILNLADLSVLDFEIWVFILIRVSFMVFLLPIYGGSQVPAMIKIGITFFLSIIIFTVLPQQEISIPKDVSELFLLALKELFVGFCIGFASSLVFVAVTIAGELIDNMMDFSIVQTFNPLTDAQESITGQLKFTLFALTMIVSGLHLYFIRIIAESYERIPLFKVNVDLNRLVPLVTEMTSNAILFGFKLAAPVIVPLLITTSALAIIARIMPQVNVWLVGMPLKIGVGLMTLAFVFPLIWEVFQKQFTTFQAYEIGILNILGGS